MVKACLEMKHRGRLQARTIAGKSLGGSVFCFLSVLDSLFCLPTVEGGKEGGGTDDEDDEDDDEDEGNV